MEEEEIAHIDRINAACTVERLGTEMVSSLLSVAGKKRISQMAANGVLGVECVEYATTNNER